MFGQLVLINLFIHLPAGLPPEVFDSVKQSVLASMIQLAVGGTVALIAYSILVKQRLVTMANGLRTSMAAFGGTIKPPTADPVSDLAELIGALEDFSRITFEGQRLIADYSQDLLMSFDAEERIISVNPGCFKLLGFHAVQIIGKSPRIFMPPEERTKFHEYLAQIRTNPGVKTIENCVTTAGGHELCLLWSAEWSQKENVFFAVAQDITERKRIENFKKEFNAMINHDLRSPLTSMQMTISMFREGVYGQLDAKVEKVLGGAQSNILRMIELINNLLDLEKLESGKMEIQQGIHSLAALYTECLAVIEPSCQPANLKVRGAVTDCFVLIDKLRISQVLTNIMANAVKYSPQNSEIAVYTEIDQESTNMYEGDDEESNKWIKILVADQGQGIPPAYTERVFDRFFQIPGTTKTGTSGLGLSICKAIVEAHGGKIGVTNNESGGSVFWFTIPLYAGGDYISNRIGDDEGIQQHNHVGEHYRRHAE
jgi:PAS domain S-box-containing protein